MIMALGCVGMGKASAKGEVPRMTKEELKARLGAPDVIVLDVRAAQDWKAGEGRIAGAVREDPKAFDRWGAKYPKEKTLVLYCA
ncbi:MAG: hypothetical protein A2075_21275 [Geobacteraceae bacterium GWC2_58_44]|nr:MAG: hypothetical protein A2075_21275 [Geobacteraceae bacterium GWC2_58_44]HBG04584.1 hypothetical protein [Geobacter sp.]